MHRHLKFAIIGNGPIARFVCKQLSTDEHIRLTAIIARSPPENVARQMETQEIPIVSSVEELPNGIDLVADCGGHSGLRTHGPAALLAGLDVVSISTGALADRDFADQLATSAIKGGATLKLLAGAIGGIDVLGAGKVGELHHVTYTGCKPPLGWKGSPADAILDLDDLHEPTLHFEGTAREAAKSYPKNANVAATVALGGLGLDETKVKLIADPNSTYNTHEVVAEGSFGELYLSIKANPLAGNPKSSALAAMSMVQEIRRRTRPIQF